ncbi:MAG: hypothetical protein KFB97_10355 [Cyanobium sp. M30B3]|nr:MAG: hypothetical protein KFB97_10355 [Cyanobium sp. M30B3]
MATITDEMDHLDQLGAKAFDGFLVRKDLVRKDSRQYPVPTYVVEFLLGRYCASTDPAEIEEGLQIVEKQLGGAPCAPEKSSCSRPAPVIRAASRLVLLLQVTLRLTTKTAIQRFRCGV